MISRGALIAAAIVARDVRLQKEAQGKGRAAYETLKGLIRRGWGETTKATAKAGKAVEESVGAGHPIIGKALGTGVKYAPHAAVGYGAYKLMEPEAQMLKARTSAAVRRKLRQFEARSYAASPHFSGGQYR